MDLWAYYTVKLVLDIYQYDKLFDFQNAIFQILIWTVYLHFELFGSRGIPTTCYYTSSSITTI